MFLENADYVRGLCSADCLKLLSMCDLDMRAHVIRSKAQIDVEIFVTEDSFIIAEDWIRKARMESRERLWTRG